MTTVTSGIDNLINTASTTPTSVSAQVNGDGTINTSTSTVTGATSGSSSKSTDVSKNDFLLLLCTQLKYQDPMSPMDNSQMLSQMAQFQSLEASNNIEKAIENLGTSYKDTVDAQKSSALTMNNASAVSLIGKQVRMKETNVLWEAKAGSSIPIQIHLGDNNEADVQILDSDGKVVKTLRATNKDSQNSTVVDWDGTTDAGQYAQAGTYKVSIVGEDKDTSLYAFVQDVVQGVTFTNTGALLKIGGRELSVSDIMDVAMENGQSGFGSISASSAVELLGKQVRVRQDSFQFNGKDNEQHQVKINANPYSEVTVAISDSDGNAVAAYKVQADEYGVATVTWNGEKVDGTYAEAGKYQILIDGAENNPTLYPYVEGTVEGVSNASGNVELRVSGENVLLSNVIDIGTTA
jgi:flagellar basal-body rod modification protein FlgD